MSVSDLLKKSKKEKKTTSKEKICEQYEKCNIHPRLGHESPREKQMYSPALSLTLTLDGGG